MWQQKGKAVDQLKVLLQQWQHDDGEFRNYVKRLTDTIKLLGAGNATGLITVGVFLTNGNKVGGAVLAAKWCFVAFMIGFAAFMAAYRSVYRFESDLEDALILLRGGAKLNDEGISKLLGTSASRSEWSPIHVAVALGLFIVGWLGSCLGVLSNY